MNDFNASELPEELTNDRLLQAQGGNPSPWNPLVMGKGFNQGAIDRIIKAAKGNPRMVTHIASEAMNRSNRAVLGTLSSGNTPSPTRLITKEEVDAVIRDVEGGRLPLQE